MVTLPALTGEGKYTIDIDTGDWDTNMAPYFAQDTSIFMGVNYIQYDLSALHATAYPHIDIDGYDVPQLVYPDGDADEQAARDRAIDAFLGDKPGAADLLGTPPEGFTMPIYPGTFHVGKPLFNDDGTIAVLNGASSMQVKFTLDAD